MRLSFDDEESFKEAAGSLRFNNPPSDPDTQGLQRVPVGSMLSQDSERNEDICFNDPPSDPDALPNTWRVGSSGSTPSQERIEVT